MPRSFLAEVPKAYEGCHCGPALPKARSVIADAALAVALARERQA